MAFPGARARRRRDDRRAARRRARRRGARAARVRRRALHRAPGAAVARPAAGAAGPRPLRDRRRRRSSCTPPTATRADGMAVWIGWARTLVCGDYLSPVEIPWISEGGSRDAYLATLRRLAPLVEQAEHVVPGHGEVLDARPRRGDPARGRRLPRGAARRRRCRSPGARRRSARSTRSNRRAACERRARSSRRPLAPLSPLRQACRTKLLCRSYAGTPPNLRIIDESALP